MTSTGGLSSRRRTAAITAPTAIPTATPPVTTTTKSPLASSRLKLPVTTAATANL